MPLHSLLIRQLARFGFKEANLPENIENWKLLLDRISTAYNDADNERYMLERSQEISSREMHRLFESVNQAQKIAHLGGWTLDCKTNNMSWSEETFHLFEINPIAGPPSYSEFLKLIYPEDLPRFEQMVKLALEKFQPFELDTRIAVNKNPHWLHIIAKPIIDNTTKMVTQLAGTMMDITLRKESEEKIRILNQQFSEAARRAGMAEVATNVLHNVGNVLNSVNVSASMLKNLIQNSEINHLPKITELLIQNKDNLEKFIKEDDKGKQLIEYTAIVSECWTKDQKKMIDETSSLISNIEHIRDIIGAQQSIGASAFGTIEQAQISDLLEDALNITKKENPNFQAIKIKKEISDIPIMFVDKIKLIQILINLIKNARDALDNARPDNREIVIKTSLEEDENTQNQKKVVISISDNGEGIKEENLTKIFSHGFTTKKTGHGFGLHVSALSAKELGGSLIAKSKGLGYGSTFTLVFPFRPINEE